MSYAVFKMCALAILAVLSLLLAACYGIKPRRNPKCR